MAVSDFATTRMQELHGSVPLVRFGTQFAFDAGAWVVALFLAEILRYEFDLRLIDLGPLLALCAAACLVQFLAGGANHLYQGRHIYGSFSEVRALLGVVLASTVILGIPVAVAGTVVGIPRSTVFIALPMAFVLMGGVRYVKRLLVERSVVPKDDIQKALIFGAGYMGASIARRMTTDRNSPFLAVGLIDDDPRKRNLWLHDVRVVGSRASLSAAAQATGATALVVAIAKADASLLRDITDAAKAAHLKVLVLPPLEDLLNGKSRLNDLRDISIEDLIGRHPVDTHVESIAGYLAGKRVLVTGAGGSIGSELCRQITKFGPSELIMLDRDETGLQGTQISILGHGLLDTKDVVLADIRDAEALNVIFAERRPEVVFHAAALKHLPMLEQYPDEAWKTNVLGTLNVLEAAQAVGVTTFVNISTDKAANPTSVLGHSKRVAEKLTAWAAQESKRAYLSVRFGNVIGSRGSMLPTFTTLIEAGGPLTITHPDVTRFFMTIPEACQLVIQAGGIGGPAEVLILDMGEPVRILDVAQRMIEMSGKDIEIIYTGLRPGEKLHEELIGDHETDARPIHPKITHARIAQIRPDDLDKEVWSLRCSAERGDFPVKSVKAVATA
ncbi:nucleoside-diphosphate sugar epimerase/dehydratase [Cryobacterium sp. M23]|uniref:polysaccharide biosynthesis protein n=1 Tax=Cryobacterium sp. M23 TaxID=2048292 RepID=UPI001E3439ED|nr:nucleoside-diphosphate sugar epimerase/dehydratase [Cryobacterium sp. M23]